MAGESGGLVIFVKRSDSGRALLDTNRLAIDFLAKDFPRPQQAAINPAVNELKKFRGFYAPRAPRDQIFAFLDDLRGGTRIRVINGRLTRSSLFGKPEPLLCVGKNLFRSEKEPEGTTIFFTNESGGMALVGNGLQGIPYSERSYLVIPLLRIALLALCLFFMLTSLPFALVWIFLKLVASMKDVRHLSVRVPPLLSPLGLSPVPLCFSKLNGSQIGTFNLWTLGIFLGTFSFPILSVLGLGLVLRVPRDEIHRGVRIHSLLASSACCVIAGFLWSWHLVALRLWAAI